MSNSTKTIGWLFLFVLIIFIIITVGFIKNPSSCEKPITYRLGNIDERFNLSREEFRTAVNTAAGMWGKPLAHNLFIEQTNGEVEINLVYDYRQEATDKLKSLHYKFDRSRANYEELKSRLEILRTQYNEQKSAFDSDLNAYNEKIKSFNAEIESWNRRGEVPDSIHTRLMNEKDQFIVWNDSLKRREEELKSLIDIINSIVVVINEIATNSNMDLVDQQNIGNTLGHQFCEGLYEYKKGKRSITIYQYDNEYRLVRVLAHEFGHALGLKHSKSSDAVMYPFIQSDSLALADDDVTALKGRCKIQ